MAARNGEVRAVFAEPGESDDAMLAVERLERSEEPLAGSVWRAGDVREECSVAGWGWRA